MKTANRLRKLAILLVAVGVVNQAGAQREAQNFSEFKGRYRAASATVNLNGDFTRRRPTSAWRCRATELRLSSP